MERPDRILRRSKRRSKCCITGVVAVLTVVVVAVVVAAAVTMTRKNHARDLDTTLLVPLYIYPDPGSWDPLFESSVCLSGFRRTRLTTNRVIKYPSQQFLVVINPHSGPSSTTFPSFEYTAQIQNLTQFPNVRPVGYVRTGYASRNVEEVLRDVSLYSGWITTDRAGVNATAVAMHGIFFDEAPHEYSDENAEYMSRINTAVKDAAGILSPKTVRSPETAHHASHLTARCASGRGC
jgi:Spherulation-specific family 4